MKKRIIYSLVLMLGLYARTGSNGFKTSNQSTKWLI